MVSMSLRPMEAFMTVYIPIVYGCDFTWAGYAEMNKIGSARNRHTVGIHNDRLKFYNPIPAAGKALSLGSQYDFGRLTRCLHLTYSRLLPSVTPDCAQFSWRKCDVPDAWQRISGAHLNPERLSVEQKLDLLAIAINFHNFRMRSKLGRGPIGKQRLRTFEIRLVSGIRG